MPRKKQKRLPASPPTAIPPQTPAGSGQVAAGFGESSEDGGEATVAGRVGIRWELMGVGGREKRGRAWGDPSIARVEGDKGGRGKGPGPGGPWGVGWGDPGVQVGPDLPAAAETPSNPQPSSSSSGGGRGGDRRPQRLPASADTPASPPPALPAGQPQRPSSRPRERGMARLAAPRERDRGSARRRRRGERRSGELRSFIYLFFLFLLGRKKSRYAGAPSFCGWNEPSVRPAGERRAALSEMTRSNPARRGSRRGARRGSELSPD